MQSASAIKNLLVCIISCQHVKLVSSMNATAICKNAHWALLCPGSRLPLPLGYPLMDIIPPQADPLLDPNPPSSTLGQALHSIPEEDAATGQTEYATAAAEAAVQSDESAALSVGCALLMQLAVEEGMTVHPCGSASTGMRFQMLWVLLHLVPIGTSGFAAGLRCGNYTACPLNALFSFWSTTSHLGRVNCSSPQCFIIDRNACPHTSSYMLSD